jgi:hypothetical protein
MSVVMLGAIILGIVMLSVVMPCVIMLYVTMTIVCYFWLGGSRAKARNKESLIRLYSICSW